MASVELVSGSGPGEITAQGQSATTQGERVCARRTWSHSQPASAWGQGSQPAGWTAAGLALGWRYDLSGPDNYSHRLQPLEGAKPYSKHFTF